MVISACFVCSYCHEALTATDHHLYQGKFYCRMHFELKQAFPLAAGNLTGLKLPKHTPGVHSLMQRPDPIAAPLSMMSPLSDIASQLKQNAGAGNSTAFHDSSEQVVAPHQHVVQLALEVASLKERINILENENRFLVSTNTRLAETNKNVESTVKVLSTELKQLKSDFEKVDASYKDAMQQIEELTDSAQTYRGKLRESSLANRDLANELELLRQTQKNSLADSLPIHHIISLSSPRSLTPSNELIHDEKTVKTSQKPQLDEVAEKSSNNSSSLTRRSMPPQSSLKYARNAPFSAIEDDDPKLRKAQSLSSYHSKITSPQLLQAITLRVGDLETNDVYEDDAEDLAKNYLAFALSKSRASSSVASSTPDRRSYTSDTYAGRQKLMSSATFANALQHAAQNRNRRSSTQVFLTNIAAATLLKEADEEIDQDQIVVASGSESPVVVSASKQAEMDREMQLRNEGLKLKLMAGWLEKRSPTYLMGWQKRYVAVTDFNMYYASFKFDCPFPSDPEQNKALLSQLNCVPLLVVKSIAARTFKSKESDDFSFEVQARDSKTGELRDYLFRANNAKVRDDWVASMNEHRDYMMKMLQWTALSKEAKIDVAKN